MTESEWLSCADPRQMVPIASGRRSDCCGCLWSLHHHRGVGPTHSTLPHNEPCPDCDNQPWLKGYTRLASDRKLRLFACASARRRWSMLADPKARAAVEAAEFVADGSGPASADANYRDREFNKAEAIFEGAKRFQAECCLRSDAAAGARDIVGSVVAKHIWPHQTDILRDIVGNPFHQVRVGCVILDGVKRGRGIKTTWVHPDLLTPQVADLAQGAYQERNADGALDGFRLRLLADALLDAGCCDETILEHLRSPGPHFRGCWVIDLILGKE